MWNQYNAVLQRLARINNLSEGWHNRFQVVFGRQHPSVYTFFTELGKEQADTECMLRQLNLGQKIRKGRNMVRLKVEKRIHNIVSNYDEFVNNNDIIAYLTAIGHNLKF